MRTFFYLLIFIYQLFANDHLLLNRIVVKPDAAELISIYNPTEKEINLKNYYLSDSNEYYKITSEPITDWIDGIRDFLFRFPDNFSILPSDSIIVSF